MYVSNGGSKCSVISERQTGFLINAYGSTSLEKALISCVDTKCSLTTANEGYYKNSDSTVDKKLNALIKCNSSGCYKMDSVNGYYLNNAVHYSITDSLIYCNEDGCNTVNGDGNIYLNKDVTNSFNNALINCDGKQCSLINGKEGYYLNSGGTTFVSDVLIKCENNECTITAGVPGYFINNAVTNSLKNSLIFCNEGNCNLISANENDIYLYAMTNIKLIQCLSIKCIYYSKSWETESPSIYRNAAVINTYENQLIKCVSDGCHTENGNGNTSYYNGNYDSTGKFGDKIHEGILCKNNNCELVLKYELGKYKNFIYFIYILKYFFSIIKFS